MTAFAEGNLYAVLSNVGERTVDLTQLAAALDRVLSDAPTKRGLASPRVKEVALDTAGARAGQAFLLIPSLREAAPGGE